MTDTSLAPEDAFALLGTEMRMDILRALYETPQEPISFSELRSRVGVRDSGQFNYHLSKLVGRFVRKTDAGYELTLAGWNVLGAILAGTYTQSGSLPTVAYDQPCRECGGTIELTYEDERATVACADCGERYSSAGVPPGVFEGFEADELPERFERYMRSLVKQSELGICVSCAGRVESRVVLPDAADEGHDGPHVRHDCQRCPETVTASVGSLLLDHPAVVSFYYDHGVDLREEPRWTLGWLAEPSATVDSTDPLRVRVVVELDDDQIALTIDEDGDVVAVE